MTARALEVVGERWSLLIVRDLLPARAGSPISPARLDPITPTRLTGPAPAARSRGGDRAGAGRDREGGLVPADRCRLDLEPAIDELTFWGIEHAKEPPRADEPVHCEAAMIGTKVWLNR